MVFGGRAPAQRTIAAMLPWVAPRTRKRFSVLLDLGFGKRVQVAEDAGPLGLDAGGPHAATQFALQDQCKEGAEDVAADDFVALVEDGPCLEQGPARLETLLGFVEGG